MGAVESIRLSNLARPAKAANNQPILIATHTPSFASPPLQMATRTGDIDVYLLRAARLELDGGRQEETPQAPREAVTLSFLRVPPSRHISLRPHIFSSFSFTASRTYRRSGVAGFHTEEAAVQPGATVPAGNPNKA